MSLYSDWANANCGPDDDLGPEDLDRIAELKAANERAYHEARERQICRYCRGTTLNYTDPNDGGSCPHCFGGYEL